MNPASTPKNVVRFVYDTGNGYEMGPELRRH